MGRNVDGARNGRGCVPDHIYRGVSDWEDGVMWRPIETAPRDGTEILIYREGWQEAPRAKWGDHDGEDENDKPTVFGGWFLASEWHTHGVEDGFLGWNEDIQDGAMPTHWSNIPRIKK